MQLQKPSYNFKGTDRYIIDMNQRTINVGDRVEIKRTCGGYGETETIVDTITEINVGGCFKLEKHGLVSHYESYDFENSAKYGKYILKTTAKHGFGAMDEHAHDVYVKIISNK